jgi:hypothetical protein
LQNFLVVDGKK